MHWRYITSVAIVMFFVTVHPRLHLLRERPLEWHLDRFIRFPKERKLHVIDVRSRMRAALIFNDGCSGVEFPFLRYERALNVFYSTMWLR